LNCEEIDNRKLIGWSGTLLLGVGLPIICIVLATLYLKRKFKSALSYFLVRSVFSGFGDSAAGFGFKIFCLGRVFFLVFIVTSPAWTGDTLQLIGLQGLITTTLFVEGLTQPRTTRFMNILESVEELILFVFLEIGFAATGLQACVGLGARAFLVSAQRALVALAVAVNDDPAASTVHHEAGLYTVLAVHIVPMLVFAAHQSLNGIRVLVQRPRNALLPWPPGATKLSTSARWLHGNLGWCLY
jgi:hypothetical protein